MTEYIDRNKLGIGKCNPDVFENKGYAEGWNSAIDVIAQAPTEDVAPVVHGKWIDHGSYQECSVCHEEQHGIDNFRFYCSNCGAKCDL